MIQFLAQLRQAWMYTIFMLQLALFVPIFYIAGRLPYPKGHAFALWLNHVFSWIFATIAFMRPRVRYQNPTQKPKPSQAYVIVANHTSVLDIPTLALTPFPTVFVGKDVVADHVPFFFEYMYKFHIRLNRQSLRSKHLIMVKATKILNTGFHVAFFPEGGIRSKTPPIVAPFQNGAFKLAIETKTPVLPIALPYNWIIAPKYRTKKPYLCPMIAHVMEPIPTKDMTSSDVPLLLQRAYEAIHTALRQYHPKELPTQAPHSSK